MNEQNRIVFKSKNGKNLMTESGTILSPPSGWELLPPGDAALTRSVKKAGSSWQIQVKRGRRIYSGGIWAPGEHIAKAILELEAKRSTPAYARKRESDLKRRAKKHEEYVVQFYEETLKYLAFHPIHRNLAEKLAKAVTDLATPVGSGTVARTRRIPVNERSKAAVIAWMRHQTTLYDHMKIPRIKGKRRDVRRALAKASQSLLDQYRRENLSDSANCPLQHALKKAECVSK